MHVIKTILSQSNNWGEILNALKKIDPSGRESGFLFEKFAKLYFQFEPSICGDYKNVWLFRECPNDIKAKLSLGSIDYGVDLVLEGRDQKFTVVQCKFRISQDKNLSWTKDKIANLFAEGDKADHFIVFTNASGLDEHSKNKKGSMFSMITLGDLLNIKEITFANMAKMEKGGEIKFKPRDYQIDAINDVIEGFEKSQRGQLILPCGAGKTYTSLWIKEKINAGSTLVLVPSLALLRQTKNEWHAQQKKWLPYLCVCSEKDIDSTGNDSIMVHTYEIGSNVTTSANEIELFLRKNKKCIIYSTYQSLKVLAGKAKELNFSFDLAICDEAHKTAGLKSSTFGLVHADENIEIKKRLYMTATPRIVSETVKKNMQENESILVADMSDSKIFGKEFHRMSFGEAIEKEILVDYQIIAIGVSDKEVQQLIQNRFYSGCDYTAEDIANNFALEKVMRKYQATHSITFHSTIQRAIDFHERHKKILPDIFIETVTGKQSTNKRNIIMNGFKNEKSAILTNARCLTEGIDVPAIDLIYFCDPKNSKVDIVQASGRALRKSSHKNKKKGYIVVPIFHKDQESIENAIEESSFRNLIAVVRALCDQDERLQIEINNLKLKKEQKKDVATDRLSLDFEDESIIVFSEINERLKKALFDQVIEKNSDNWEINFEKFKNFLDRNNGEYPKITPMNKSEKKLANWVTVQRLKYKKDSLEFKYFEKLESIGFIWNQQEYNFLIKIKKLQDFIKKTGKYPSQKSKDKEESRLAIFCQDSRTRRRKGDLNEISIKRFNDMNFVWEPYKSNFEDNLLKVAEFIEEHKRPPMIRYSKNKKERALAEWLNTQLEKSNEGKITPEEIKKMKTLNIKIEEIESAFQNIIDNKEKDAWMQNFEKVKKIKIEKNRWPYGSRYRGEGWREEVGLYAWLYKQRKDFKSKVLQDWKKEKLDEIGEWQPKTDKTSYDEIWLENFEKLKSFVKKNNRFPTAMIKGTEERVLTNWCGTQRNLYYGRLKNYAPLPKWRIDKMNSIGFDWGGEVERKSFADRFNELKNWIQQHDGAYPKTQRKKNDLKINPERQEENSLYEWLARQNRRKDTTRFCTIIFVEQFRFSCISHQLSKLIKKSKNQIRAKLSTKPAIVQSFIPTAPKESR
jgi:superfamily II DNA or RNA helicase